MGLDGDHIEPNGADRLMSFRLKAVVKESHGAPIVGTVFCKPSQSEMCTNLLASVGGNQLTVYDDSHMGENFAVVAHYVHETAGGAGADLAAVAWVPIPRAKRLNSQEGPKIAVATTDGAINIISIVESQVVASLQSRTQDIFSMMACAYGEEQVFLLVLMKSGRIDVWDIENGHLAAEILQDASAMSLLTENDNEILLGLNDGRILRCKFSELLSHNVDESFGDEIGRVHRAVRKLFPVPGSKAIVHCVDNIIYLWDLINKSAISKYTLPSTPKADCHCDVTSCGNFLLCGDENGDGYLLDSASGKELARISIVRVNAPVNACAISENGSHLILTAGNGFLFRFLEVLSPVQNDDEEEENLA